MDSKIVIGSDHGGFELKKKICIHLKSKGYEINDVGTFSEESCDYPDFACDVSEKVSSGEYNRGIVICTSGIGVSICANKSKAIRAALCTSIEQAIMSRKHNDSNVLALSSKFSTVTNSLNICDVWLTTNFEGGRHEKRINKITNFENRKNQL